MAVRQAMWDKHLRAQCRHSTKDEQCFGFTRTRMFGAFLSVLSVLLPTVAAWRFLPSRMGCNGKERDVMGGLVQASPSDVAGGTVFQNSYSACFSL